tara:strand:- start:730 stop:1170 length:441 start_codon:yes stop_codon:yes gene_type:complete
MIEKGQLTIIDFETFRCVGIEGAYALLKNVLHEQGRPKKVRVDSCPYIVDGAIVIPTPPAKKKVSSKINIREIVKDNTDLQWSRSATAFIVEWAETTIGNLIAMGEINAKKLGHSRITAAHIYWLETGHDNIPEGFWPSNEDYING